MLKGSALINDAATALWHGLSSCYSVATVGNPTNAINVADRSGGGNRIVATVSLQVAKDSAKADSLVVSSDEPTSEVIRTVRAILKKYST